MKKSNVILQTAIAAALLGAAGSASASISTSSRSFATELFLGSSPATTALSIAPIAYQFNGPVAAQTLYVYVALSGSANFSTALVTATDLTGTYSDNTSITNTCTTAGGGTGTASCVTAVTLSTDKTFAVFTLIMANSKAFNSVNVLSYTPQAGAVINANGALATAGGTLNATVTFDSTLTTTTASAGTIDTGGTHAGAIANSAQGITITAASSGNFPFNSGGVAETAKINLAAVPISTLFTAPGAGVSNANSTTVLNLGAIRATNSSGVVNATNTAYTLAGQMTTTTALAYTITAPAGFFAPLGTAGSAIKLTSDATCTTTLATSGSTAFSSAAAAAAATSVAVTGALQATSGTNSYICMTVNGSTTIVAGTPSLTATLSHTATVNDSNETLAATNLYTLTTNGSTVDVRSYIPLVTTGYTSFVRVINSGAVASAVTGQWLYEDGTSSTAATLLASLPVLGSKTLTSTQIEAALGTPNASIGNNRPRLRLTATTNGLQAQSFILTTANGNFSDATGAQ